MMHSNDQKKSEDEKIAKRAKIIKLIDVPPQVDLADLKDQKEWRLLDETEAKLLERVMEGLPLGRYSKKELGEKMAALGDGNWPANTPATRGIIKEPDGTLYVVYKGRKKRKDAGEGGFGKVKLVQDMRKGGWCALKVISEELQKKMEKKVLRELVENEHKALSATKAGHGELIERKAAVGGVKKYHFVMDYIKGKDLCDIAQAAEVQINNPNPLRLSAIQWLDIALKAAQSIQALHKQGYLHCDIKLENIMCDLLNNKVGAIDLGFALRQDAKRVTTPRTEGYMAPELDLLRQPLEPAPYSTASDMYAFGKTLEMLFSFSTRTTCPFSNDKKMKKMIEAMTHENPSRRPQFGTVIKKLEDFRKQLLPIIPRTTGIIDVNEYLGAENKQVFIHALKAVDTVVLTIPALPENRENETTEDLIRYSTVKKELEAEGIVVRDEMLVDKNPMTLISTVYALDRKNKDNVVIPYVCYISEKEKPGSLHEMQFLKVKANTCSTPHYRREISDRHQKNMVFDITDEELRRIQKILFNEINRLSKAEQQPDQNPSSINALHNMIYKLENNYQQKTLTAYTLYTELESLQKKLLESPPPSTSLFLKHKTVRVVSSLTSQAKSNLGKKEKLAHKLQQIDSQDIPKMKR